MQTISDLLHLPYTPDLTEAGITCACRSLVAGTDRMGSFSYHAMRRIVARVAVELSFRRYLTEQRVRYKILAPEPFTHPDDFKVSLGGHRCELISYLISRQREINQIRHDPGRILQSSALVPMDSFTARMQKRDELYLFSYLLGLTTATRTEQDRAFTAGKPAFLIHLLPRQWARPVNWLPFEKLVLKSEMDQPIEVELGGLDAQRNFVTTKMDLPPHTKITIEKTFYSIAYVNVKQKPTARVGLYCPRLGEAHLIHPFDWGNLWISGMDIFLAGWLTHDEFHHHASRLGPGVHTLQFDRTRVNNLQVPMSELNPIGSLLEQVRKSDALQVV
jgi:hypothetical protein